MSIKNINITIKFDASQFIKASRKIKRTLFHSILKIRIRNFFRNIGKWILKKTSQQIGKIKKGVNDE